MSFFPQAALRNILLGAIVQHQDVSGANTLVQHCVNSSVTDPHLYVKVPQPQCAEHRKPCSFQLMMTYPQCSASDMFASLSLSYFTPRSATLRYIYSEWEPGFKK